MTGDAKDATRIDFAPARLIDSAEVRFLTDAYPDFISYVDSDHRYRFVNQAYVDATGRSSEELIGRTIEEVWGSQAGGPTANVRRALTGESFLVQMPFLDGQYMTTYAPHRNSAGVVVGVLVYSRDVTELHTSRVALLQAEKMAAIGRLVAGLMHELNTPLGVVRANLDVLGRGLARVLGESGEASRSITGKLQNVVESTRPAVERMVSALEGLRRFTHLDEPEEQEVDLEHQLEDTLSMMQRRIPSDVTLERDYSEVPRLRGRPAELNQVLMHLLSNALAAIEGEGRITVRTRATEGAIEIDVADTGRGIEADRIPTLFEPQLSKTGTRVRAGMGLFISRDIAERHGGTLKVKSTPGQGSCFTLSLPR